METHLQTVSESLLEEIPYPPLRFISEEAFFTHGSVIALSIIHKEYLSMETILGETSYCFPLIQSL